MRGIGEKLVDVNRVRSVVETKYYIKERVVAGWFTTKKCIEEELNESEKQVYEGGRINERTGFVHYFDGDKSHRVYCRRLYEYCDGLEVACRGYDNKGTLVYERKTEYYSNNKLKRTDETISLSNEERGGTIDTYSYDSHGNVTEHSTIHEKYTTNEFGFKKSIRKRSWIERSKWIYEDTPREILEIEDNERDCYRTERRYDRSYRLIKEIDYGEQGNVVGTIEYIYDNYGRINKKILDSCYVEESRYNEHGDCVWHKWYPHYSSRYSWENKYEPQTTTYEYRYDDNGNWIEEKEIHDGVYLFLTTRKIEYWY